MKIQNKNMKIYNKFTFRKKFKEKSMEQKKKKKN